MTHSDFATYLVQKYNWIKNHLTRGYNVWYYDGVTPVPIYSIDNVMSWLNELTFSNEGYGVKEDNFEDTDALITDKSLVARLPWTTEVHLWEDTAEAMSYYHKTPNILKEVE